jgi:FkbM family methyltransferase
VEKFILAAGLKLKNGKIEFPINIKKIKIDVGLSGNAPQSEIWTQRDPELLVIGFEPLGKNRKMIADFSSPWPIKLDPHKIRKSVFVVPVALSSKRSLKDLKMYITEDDAGSSSLLVPIGLSFKEFEFVPVFSLDDFFSFFPFSKFRYVDHLKIDAQGMDLEILKGSSKYLKYISYITAEQDQQYEGTKNSKTYLRIYLMSKGFIKVGFLTLILMRKIFKHDISVDDPTYFNSRLVLQNRRNLFIYQRG